MSRLSPPLSRPVTHCPHPHFYYKIRQGGRAPQCPATRHTGTLLMFTIPTPRAFCQKKVCAGENVIR